MTKKYRNLARSALLMIITGCFFLTTILSVIKWINTYDSLEGFKETAQLLFGSVGNFSDMLINFISDVYYIIMVGYHIPSVLVIIGLIIVICTAKRKKVSGLTIVSVGNLMYMIYASIGLAVWLVFGITNFPYAAKGNGGIGYFLCVFLLITIVLTALISYNFSFYSTVSFFNRKLNNEASYNKTSRFVQFMCMLIALENLLVIGVNILMEPTFLKGNILSVVLCLLNIVLYVMITAILVMASDIKEGPELINCEKCGNTLFEGEVCDCEIVKEKPEEINISEYTLNIPADIAKVIDEAREIASPYKNTLDESTYTCDRCGKVLHYGIKCFCSEMTNEPEAASDASERKGLISTMRTSPVKTESIPPEKEEYNKYFTGAGDL